nr:hypothetical protein [Desulfobacula sp.]
MKMRSLLQKMILLALVLTMISGCATTGAQNPDPKKADETRTKTEGAVVGTAVGAGAGAAIGAIMGGSKNTVAGAVVGGIIGLIAGAALGESVAEKKQEYVDAESRLDNEIKIAVASNAQLKDYNSQTETRIVALNEEISLLNSRQKAGEDNLKQLMQKQNEIRTSITEGEQQKLDKEKDLKALNEYLSAIDQNQQQLKTAQLQEEIDKLRENILMLDDNNKQLAKMDDSLTVRK